MVTFPLPPQKRAIELVKQATELGRNQILVMLGEKRMMVSRRAAEKLVGKKSLRTWEDNGLIKGYRKGGGNSKIEYNILDLRQLQLSDTYCYFLN